MRGALDQPDFLYQATRVYLMLGSQGPLDRDLVAGWMRLDWEQAFPGPDMATVRADLLQHLTTLLALPLPSITLDGGLVDAARVTFSRVAAAQQLYSRIVLSLPRPRASPSGGRRMRWVRREQGSLSAVRVSPSRMVSRVCSLLQASRACCCRRCPLSPSRSRRKAGCWANRARSTSPAPASPRCSGRWFNSMRPIRSGAGTACSRT